MLVFNFYSNEIDSADIIKYFLIFGLTEVFAIFSIVTITTDQDLRPKLQPNFQLSTSKQCTLHTKKKKLLPVYLYIICLTSDEVFSFASDVMKNLLFNCEKSSRREGSDKFYKGFYSTWNSDKFWKIAFLVVFQYFLFLFG